MYNLIDQDGLKSTENLGMKYSSYLDEKDFNEMILEGRTEDEYLEDYCMIVDYALLRGLEKKNINFYTEKHHILPRCMEGEDSDYNYVLLTFLEHLIIHILLYRIYPENTRIATAAVCMTNSTSRSDLNNKLKQQVLDNLLNVLNELRIAFRSNFKKSVVCFDKDFNVAKVYEFQSDVVLDGFQNSKVSNVISGKRKITGGYYWDYLSNFEKNHSHKLVEYYNKLDKGYTPNISPIKIERRIICLDENNNILKIYKNINSTRSDGFDPKLISAALSLKKQKSSGGYYWKFYRDFEDSAKIEEYYKNNITTPELSPIKIESRIVCLNIIYKIVKIYDFKEHTISDGFDVSSVSNALKIHNMYGGYYWRSFSEYIIYHNDEVEEYYNNSNKIDVHKLSWNYVCLDDDRNIIKVYDNDSLRSENIYKRNITESIKSNSKFKGYIWMNINDVINLIPDKLEEYYKQQEQK
jgi:hypothetical protein